MRIERPEADHEYYRQCRRELEGFLRHLDDRQSRPCPGCRVPCPCRGSTTCTCNCSSACPHVTREMSSDPDRYPIEPGIVPLVYSLNSVRVCRPCWSCEGHYDAAGKLYKLPRVWFYARSVVFPELVAEYLAELRIARRLTATWRLSVVNWGDTLEAAFAIEPNFSGEEFPRLSRLRCDVRTIAADLLADIKLRARRRMADLTASLRVTA